jgi:hypothetical protein
MKMNGQLPAPWTSPLLAQVYEQFQIKDERALCTCGRFTPRSFDGKCYSCHLKFQKQLGQPYCPPLP